MSLHPNLFLITPLPELCAHNLFPRKISGQTSPGFIVILCHRGRISSHGAVCRFSVPSPAENLQARFIAGRVVTPPACRKTGKISITPICRKTVLKFFPTAAISGACTTAACQVSRIFALFNLDTSFLSEESIPRRTSFLSSPVNQKERPSSLTSYIPNCQAQYHRHCIPPCPCPQL